MKITLDRNDIEKLEKLFLEDDSEDSFVIGTDITMEPYINRVIANVIYHNILVNYKTVQGSLKYLDNGDIEFNLK